MISRLLLLGLALALTAAPPAGAQQTTWPPMGGRGGVPPYAFYTQPHAFLGQPAQPICRLTPGATVNSDGQSCLNNPKAGVGYQSVTLTGASTLALPTHLPAAGGLSIVYMITHSGADGPTLGAGFQPAGGAQPPTCNGTTIITGCWSTSSGQVDWLPCVSVNATSIGCGSPLTNVGSSVAVTAWSPSHTDTTAITLSGGNLIATLNSGVIAATYGAPTFTGSHYYQITATGATGADVSIGVGNASSPTVDNSSFCGGDVNSVCYFASGVVYTNNAQTGGTIATWSSGQAVCIAVSSSLKKVWFQPIGSGQWDNNADNPSTGVGGFDLTAMMASNANLVPGATPDRTLNPSTATLNVATPCAGVTGLSGFTLLP